MKIAFITDSSPLDINAWSGTIYHVFKELSKRHTVVPLGVGMSVKTYWHHQFTNERLKMIFNVYHRYGISK